MLVMTTVTVTVTTVTVIVTDGDDDGDGDNDGDDGDDGAGDGDAVDGDGGEVYFGGLAEAAVVYCCILLTHLRSCGSLAVRPGLSGDVDTLTQATFPPNLNSSGVLRSQFWAPFLAVNLVPKWCPATVGATASWVCFAAVRDLGCALSVIASLVFGATGLVLGNGRSLPFMRPPGRAKGGQRCADFLVKMWPQICAQIAVLILGPASSNPCLRSQKQDRFLVTVSGPF